jgi:hypothetical protein
MTNKLQPKPLTDIIHVGHYACGNEDNSESKQNSTKVYGSNI